MALVPLTATAASTFGEFLKTVVDAGGKAHLTTFARLGVTNSPSVRDSFPVLLAHGVPEEVLLAILAGAASGAAEVRCAGAPALHPGIHGRGARSYGAEPPGRDDGGD